jgi:hypothetical protein
MRALRVFFSTRFWTVATGLFLAFAPGSPAVELSKSATMVVKTKGGAAYTAAFQEFHAQAGIMVFLKGDGKTEFIASETLDDSTLGASAMRMRIVADWLPEDAVRVIKPLVDAADGQAETAALQTFLARGRESKTIREKLAWFQIYGLAFHLINSEKSAQNAVDAYSRATQEVQQIKAILERDLKTRRFSRLGDDRGPWMVDVARKKIALTMEKPARDMPAAKKELMVRLAAANGYANYCPHLDRQDVGQAVADLRKKIVQRSVVGREMESAADAILGWLITRCLIHHYEGDEETYIVRIFGKMVVDAQIDPAFELLFFDLPDNTRPLVVALVKGALMALSEGRASPIDIANGATREALINHILRKDPNTANAAEIVERILPFVEEAVRLKSN